MTAANARRIGPDPVAVHVGEEGKIFLIHENVICANSEYFARALKKEWAEGENRQIHLRDTDPDVFAVWAKWLYTGRLCYLRAVYEGQNKSFFEEFDDWTDIYVLGDYLQDMDFKDAALDAHIEGMLEYDKYIFKLPKWIYEYTKKGSPHRKLAVDMYCQAWKRDDYTRDDDIPPEFFHDVVISIGPRLSSGIEQWNIEYLFRNEDLCKYHEHGSEKPCYKTKPAFRL